jgi:hypothetical protein
MKSALWMCLLFLIAAPALAQGRDTTSTPRPIKRTASGRILTSSLPFGQPIILSSTINNDFVQPRTAWNTAYIELFGSAVAGSFNYERLLSNHFVLRGGIFPLFTFSDSGFIIPLTLSLLVGDGERLFEVGGGGRFFIGTGSGIDYPKNVPIAPLIIVCYRYQPKADGCVFRTGFTFHSSPSGWSNFIFDFGDVLMLPFVSLGITF